MNANHQNPKPPTAFTERQLDQLWIEQERERCTRLANASRARTFAPQSRCRFTRLEPVRKASPGIALCVFALTIALLAIQATGAAPFVKAWLWSCFA